MDDLNLCGFFFELQIDECRRLWVLDTGRIADRQQCAPQLLIFNLDNDTLIHRYRFPKSLYKSAVSLFITPVRCNSLPNYSIFLCVSY